MFVPFGSRSFPRETVVLIIKKTRILPAAGARFAEAVDAALRQVADGRSEGEDGADAAPLRALGRPSA